MMASLTRVGVSVGAQTHGHPRPCPARADIPSGIIGGKSLPEREGPTAASEDALRDGRGRSEAEAVCEPMLTPSLIRQAIIGIRRQKLPAVEELGSAGSFFCNPVISREHFHRIEAIAQEEQGPDYQVPHYDTPDGVKVPAAWMIEQCGFKGARSGGAQVYQKQPLVIVNASGTASPEDIIGLEQQIIKTIEQKYGITLHPEVEHV